MMEMLAGLAGACAAGAMIAAAIGVRGRTTHRPDGRPPARWRMFLRSATDRGRRRRLLIATGVGLVTFAVLRWPVAAIAPTAGAMALPRLLSGREGARRITRLEALEQWARRLAEVLGASRGLEQTLIDSVRVTPDPIRSEVGVLADRLRNRANTELALRAFAADLDDPVGDLIAAALILAAHRRGPGARDALGTLADAVAKEVQVRREVEAERASLRTTLLVIVISVIGLSVLFITARSLAAPFGTPLGQLVLAVVAGVYALGLWWMHRLTLITTGARILTRPAILRAPRGDTQSYGPVGREP